ncbi:MAG: hypothetical protein NVS9B1_23300 [Candidatus Dormibacteraceae bacterium]
MRFPFTFMGLLSLALGAWITGYVVLHPSRDPVLLGLEIAPALVLAGFGAYVLYRRFTHGSAA